MVANELSWVVAMTRLQYDFEQSVGYWLTKTTQAYHRAFTEELVQYGITYRQSQVLSWLALEGELTQSQLAAKMVLEPPTLVGILDRMERAGWISRHSCQQDRRKKWIRVTEEAKPVWDKIAQVGKRMRKRATNGISDRQIATLKQLLNRIEQNVQSEDLAVSEP